MAQMTSLNSLSTLLLAFLLLVLLLGFLARRLGLRWWPAWPLRVLLVGLVLLGLLWSSLWLAPRDLVQRQVMLVDLSDSLSEAVRREAWQQAESWQAGGENRLLVGFGAAPELALPVAGEMAGSSLPVLDGRASRLDDALLLAGQLLDGSHGRVILASDGLADQPSQVDEAVVDLVENGHVLDVIPLAARSTENDLALGSLISPRSLWAGTGFNLVAPVYGAEDGAQVRLQLRINGQDTPTNPEPAGGNAYRIPVPPLPEGVVDLQVMVSGADGTTDPMPGNNTAFAVLRVFAPPGVLLVSDEAGEEPVTRFVQNLTSGGVQVEIARPEALPTNLETLQTYQVILLHNLPASRLSHEQMVALQVFASRLAGGVVFLGGRSSYTLGGYQDTLLEDMLPLALEPPPRSERTPIVFELVLDRSSSMQITRIIRGFPPIVLAREAAMRSIETLSAEDYLGLLTFSDEYHWDIPIRPLGGEAGLQQALDAVGGVNAMGGTQMFQAMEEGVAIMAGLPESAPLVRHILVLSDGQSTDGTGEEFRRLAASAAAEGITISTIALGPDADTELLSQIADVGGGRYYGVQEAAELPRILIAESEASRSENVQSGETALEPGEAGHPVLSGAGQGSLPLLRGYNALSSKVDEGAEDILVSANFGDPVLSAWQYGLGRVVAWTGDIGEEWAGGWTPESEAAFWAQVVRYVLIDPALSPAQVQVQVEADRIEVTASIYSPGGEPVNLAEVAWVVAAPDGETQSYRLTQARAGVYEVELPRPPEGAYRTVLAYTAGNGQRVEIPAPFVVNPYLEWLPPDVDAGVANLSAWASAGSGRMTSMAEVITPAEPSSQVGIAVVSDGWWLLMAVLVILWPLEIAIRRRWLPWM